MRNYGPDDNRAHNHELLADLFDGVVRVMQTARGTRHTERSEHYVDADAVRRVVEDALRKVECEALDAWRLADEPQQ